MWRYAPDSCPRCGSDLTGRLKGGIEGQKYFCFGSPVIYAADPRNYNCACAECGIQWSGVVKMKKCTVQDIHKLDEEWNCLVDSRPNYTAEEEKAIADELYNGVASDDDYIQPKKSNLFKRFLVNTVRVTNKQKDSLVDDFKDMLGIVSKCELEALQDLEEDGLLDDTAEIPNENIRKKKDLRGE